MTTRDFSDAAMGDIITGYYSSIMAGQFDAESLDDFYEHYGFRYNGSVESYDAFQKKKEYYEEMVRALQGIFRDARQYDTDTSPSFQPLQENIESVSNIMASLRGSISRGSPHGGMWRIPTEEFAAALAANSDALSAVVRNRFARLDENGNLVYDWDEIERVAQLPADQITPLEYYALAYLYSQMSEEDIARLFQRLATPDENNNKEYYKPPPPLNRWTFDEDKIACLQIALASVYAERGESFTDDAYARLSALGALPYLGVSYLNGDAYCTRSISGEYGTDYPLISISIGADKSVVIEYMSRKITVDNSSQSVISILLPDSLSLSVPKPADLAVSDLLAMIDKAIRERIGGDDDAVLIDILGFFPGLGDVLGAADIVSSIEGYPDGQQFADRIESDNKEVGALAAVYDYFGFEAVVMPLPDGSFKVFLYPGPETAQKIAGLNNLLAGVPGLISDLEYQKSLSDDDDDREINEKLKNLHWAESIMQSIGYPITEQAIMSKPQEVEALRNALNGAGIG